MRQSAIVAIAAVAIATVIAVWGNTMVATSPNDLKASAASSSISILQMMGTSKSLPEEKFDAY